MQLGRTVLPWLSQEAAGHLEFALAWLLARAPCAFLSSALPHLFKVISTTHLQPKMELPLSPGLQADLVPDCSLFLTSVHSTKPHHPTLACCLAPSGTIIGLMTSRVWSPALFCSLSLERVSPLPASCQLSCLSQ